VDADSIQYCPTVLKLLWTFGKGTPAPLWDVYSSKIEANMAFKFQILLRQFYDDLIIAFKAYLQYTLSEGPETFKLYVCQC